MRFSFAALSLVASVAFAADTPAWKPYDLGTHHRAVSTKSAAAQKAFDQGLIWSFAFNHDEAERAFQEAARQDPDLAMAWWGIALVNGPHINNPMVDEAHAKAAWEALGEARKRAAKASDVEKALIEALGARYAMPQPKDRAPLEAAYAKAMAGVSQRFPKDADVAALYAESLMDTRPWDQWTADGKPQPGTEEILAALEAALKLQPDNPLALHLTIHALEASPHPERASAAADRLRALVPDASHLVHMPSHIYARTARWTDAASANERAQAVDKSYQERQKEIGFYRIYMAHNTHFLAFTAMMQGRSAVALAKTKEILDSLSPEWVKENAFLADAFTTVHWEAEKRFGKWEEILKEPPLVPGLPVSTAYMHFVRAIANASLGRLEDAEKEQAAFIASLKDVPKDALWSANSAQDVFAVAVPYLEGELAYRKGNLDEAAAKLREAAKKEDFLKYDEPPDWTVPSRHALGAVLLEAKRPADAEAAYREDLVRYPENGWSLYGLANALDAQGKTAEAKTVRARFEKAWERADVKLPASCLCVRPAVKTARLK
jgi:tetratricopeptide (TPR) repeat protein